MKRSFVLLLAAALLLCLLPGMTPEAKAETIYAACRNCRTIAYHEMTGVFVRYNDDCHYVVCKCSGCGGEIYVIPVGDPLGYHSGGTETPTCTTGKTCAQCGAEYGKLGHDWGAWQSRGNNSEHIRHCQRDLHYAGNMQHLRRAVLQRTCLPCGAELAFGRQKPLA